jgi:uncharacterized protein (DUF1330 family)
MYADRARRWPSTAGRYLARADGAEKLEGPASNPSVSFVIEFDTADRARAWWSSERICRPERPFGSRRRSRTRSW